MLGLTLADDFVGIPETPQGLQKQIEGVPKHTRKSRVAANIKKCAVVACSEDKVDPVNPSWKWGDADRRPVSVP